MRRLWMILLLLCLTACRTAEGPALAGAETIKLPVTAACRHSRVVPRLPLVPPPPPVPVEDLEVHSDWSGLTAWTAEGPLVRYWSSGPRDRFIPSDEYGELCPYIGEDYTSYGYPYFGEGGAPQLFGLMTRDGRVVTDPLYSAVYCLHYNSEPLPVIVVSQPEEFEIAYGADAFNGYCALIAADGSWYIDMKEKYRDCTVVDKENILLQGKDGTCEVYDLSGRLVSSFSLPDGNFQKKGGPWKDGVSLYVHYTQLGLMKDYDYEYAYETVCFWLDYEYKYKADYFWLNAFTGELQEASEHEIVPEQPYFFYEAKAPQKDMRGVMDLAACRTEYFEKLIYDRDHRFRELYDKAGQYVLTVPISSMGSDIFLWNGLVITQNERFGIVMDLKGNVILRYPLLAVVD